MKRLFSMLSVLVLPWAAKAIMLENEVFENIPMGDTKKMVLRLSFDETTNEELTWNRNHCVVLTFNLTNQISWALDILNTSLTFSYEQIRRRRPQELAINGVIIGFNQMNVYGHIVDKEVLKVSKENPDKPYDPLSVPVKIIKKSENETLMEEAVKSELAFNDDEPHQVDLTTDLRVPMREIHLFVVVKDQTLPDLFTLVMTAMIILNTVNMGGQLDFSVIKDVFKSPVGPAVGFVSQFVLMPLFSFAIGYLMSSDKLFRLGLFVLGCCPGGTASNFWCILLGGDINLSITMTFVSTCAALGMMPLWVYLMSPLLTEGSLVIPYGQLIMTLIFLIAPISLGMWIRHRWPKAAPIMDKIIIPFTLLTLLFIFTVGVYINLFIFQLIDGLMVAAGFLVAIAGYLFGGVLAWAFRLNRPQITAVSIETAFQNGGIAFIILKVSFPEPFGELSTVAPVAQLVITALPLWALLFLWKGYTKCIRDPRRAKKANLEAKEEISEEEKKIIEPINANNYQDGIDATLKQV